MTTGKKDTVLMTASVVATRNEFFSPSIRQGYVDFAGQTPVGYVTVKGALTQIHRNVLDALFSHAIAIKPLFTKSSDGGDVLTGSIKILFDPYVIAQKTLSSRDYKWLADKTKPSILKDMKDAMVSLTEPDGRNYAGGIVSEWDKTARRAPMPGGKLTGTRPLMSVIVTAAWMKIYESTLSIDYKDLIPAIAALNSGVLQAFVRYCLTHRVLNMKVDQVLSHIGATPDTMSRRRRFAVKKIVIDADLSEFGIKIVNRVVFYRQHRQVYFKNPTSAATCAASAATCAASAATCAASQEIQEPQEALE